jgi:hypothetical protein
VIIPFVASLALLAPQEGRWVPTSVTPAVLAQRVDRRLATLSKATLSYQYDFEKSTVGRAFVICTGTIVSPGVFWLQVPKLDLTNAKEPMQRERWISDGKRFGMAAEPNEPKPGPIAKRPGVPSKPTQIWFSNFSRVIFSGLGQPVQPFAKLLGDAKRQGYVVSTKGRMCGSRSREQSENFLEHLVNRKRRGFNDVSVRGDGERRVFAGDVAVVAVLDLRAGLLKSRLVAPFGGTAAGSLFQARRHVELEACVGSDDGRRIAAFENDAALGDEGLLKGHHRPAHGGVAAEGACRFANLGGADRRGDVLSVEEDGLVFTKVDFGVRHEIGGGRTFDAGAGGFQRKCPIHCSGVEVAKAQPSGEELCDGAFARTGGTVDGDDELGRHRKL